jgi:hypothetical protein
MSRSNAPLALSVVSLTEPDDVEKTLTNITQFDDRKFGFNHNQTWAAMPHALRGMLDPEAVALSFSNEHVRIQRCITALCALGRDVKLDTRRFVDFPAAGLRTVAPIAWDPDVTVRVKGCCRYVEKGRTIIPLLQPRMTPLALERLQVYLRLGRHAYCQGDWVDALVALVDLAGEGEAVEAEILSEADIGLASDALLTRYVRTFVEAKKAADKKRSSRPKDDIRLPMDGLLDLDK